MAVVKIFMRCPDCGDDMELIRVEAVPVHYFCQRCLLRFRLREVKVVTTRHGRQSSLQVENFAHTFPVRFAE